VGIQLGGFLQKDVYQVHLYLWVPKSHGHVQSL